MTLTIKKLRAARGTFVDMPGARIVMITVTTSDGYEHRIPVVWTRRDLVRAILRGRLSDLIKSLLENAIHVASFTAEDAYLGAAE